MTMMIKDFLKQWLEDNGYAGLYNDFAECACSTKDLIACGDYCGDCKPGYFQPMTENQFQEHDYIIGEKYHEKITCPNCGGTGMRKVKVKCDSCDGTGKRILHLFERLIPCPNYKIPDENGMTDHKCDLCKGTQVILETKPGD